MFSSNEVASAEESDSEESSSGTVPISPASSLPGTYANFIGLIRTQHDMALDFFVIEPGANAPSSARHVSRVFVPLTIVKGLRDALDEQIQGYEEQFGFELPNLRDVGENTA